MFNTQIFGIIICKCDFNAILKVVFSLVEYIVFIFDCLFLPIIAQYLSFLLLGDQNNVLLGIKLYSTDFAVTCVDFGAFECIFFKSQRVDIVKLVCKNDDLEFLVMIDSGYGFSIVLFAV